MVIVLEFAHQAKQTRTLAADWRLVRFSSIWRLCALWLLLLLESHTSTMGQRYMKNSSLLSNATALLHEKTCVNIYTLSASFSTVAEIYNLFTKKTGKKIIRLSNLPLTLANKCKVTFCYDYQNSGVM
jgi:hypothetical protein